SGRLRIFSVVSATNIGFEACAGTGRTGRVPSHPPSHRISIRKRIYSVLSNTNFSEPPAQQAERETGILSRAFRRAARSAFLWPEEVSDLIGENRTLTELRGIGPFIEKQIQQWIEQPRRPKTVAAIRRDFLSFAEARRI